MREYGEKWERFEGEKKERRGRGVVGRGRKVEFFWCWMWRPWSYTVDGKQYNFVYDTVHGGYSILYAVHVMSVVLAAGRRGPRSRCRTLVPLRIPLDCLGAPRL